MTPFDTRGKIVSPAEAAGIAARLKSQGIKIAAVSGVFDVLLAAHARALAEVRNHTGAGALMVVLLPAPDGLLADRARAELVAALSMVDYVIIANENHTEEVLRRLDADVTIARQDQDEQVERQLIEHVQRRHSV